MRAVLVIALLVTVTLARLQKQPSGPAPKPANDMKLGPRNYEDIPTDFKDKFDAIARCTKLDRLDTAEARTAGKKIQEIIKTKERKAAFEEVWVFITDESLAVRTALFNLHWLKD